MAKSDQESLSRNCSIIMLSTILEVSSFSSFATIRSISRPWPLAVQSALSVRTGLFLITLFAASRIELVDR